MEKVKRFAIWSGPRNLSTALMRSFGSRADFEVLDEPFYAAYLKETGIKHPMYEEIISSQSTDPRVISNFCESGTIVKPYQYQKHMTHHILNSFDKNFVLSVSNVFLIRKPALVLNSYRKKNADYKFEDLGFKQQFELFELVKYEIGVIPPVIDSEDLLKNPSLALRILCEKMGIEFFYSMLFWEPGPKSYDGIWGSYWYEEINNSDRFKPKKGLDDNERHLVDFSAEELEIIKEANTYYHEISKVKISID